MKGMGAGKPLVSRRPVRQHPPLSDEIQEAVKRGYCFASWISRFSAFVRGRSLR